MDKMGTATAMATSGQHDAESYLVSGAELP